MERALGFDLVGVSFSFWAQGRQGAMVRAALGVLYLLASATANGWNLLKLGLSPGANHTHTDHAGSHPGPSPPGRGGTSRPVPEGSKDDGHGTSWWSVAFERAYGYLGADWWLSMGIKMSYTSS